MTTLTAPDEVRLPSAQVPTGPRLHVRRAGRADRSAIPVDGKCTIGSSPRCQVCLPADDAKPLHCVVSLEGGAALATQWSPGVLLNGREFKRHPLRGGDRLTIGPWELVWESSAGGDTPAPATPRQSGELPALRAPASAPETHERTGSRPAAKTMLVASRPTEPFATFAAAQGPLAVASPAAAPTHPSQLFQDRLVVSLWTAAYAGRRRARTLAAAARSARRRSEELTAAVAELENALAAARADAAADRERTLADAQSAAESTTAQHEAQLEALRGELAQAMADRDGALAELEALRTAAKKTAPPDIRLQTLAESADAARREADRLRETVADRDNAVADLQQQVADAEAARAALSQQLLEAQQQQQQWLAECQALEEERGAALAETLAERDRLQAQAEELAQQLAELSSAAPSPAIASTDEVATGPFSPREESTSRASDAALREAPPACLAEDAASPTTEACAPTSFIDKYRHLLEDAEEPAPSLDRQRPILDEEFLSPAKFENSVSLEDDSDEALEAYMANMMRRMRSAGQSSTIIEVAAPQGMESPPAPTRAPVPATTPSTYALDRDSNGLLRGARRTPIAADLAALRDLANSSARSAIATHRLRRNVESSLSKALVCGLSAGAAAYLLVTAPGVGSPWFWGGCAALTAAAVAGAQVVSLAWQRWSDRRHVAAMSAPSLAAEPVAAAASVDNR